MPVFAVLRDALLTLTVLLFLQWTLRELLATIPRNSSGSIKPHLAHLVSPSEHLKVAVLVNKSAKIREQTETLSQHKNLPANSRTLTSFQLIEIIFESY